MILNITKSTSNIKKLEICFIRNKSDLLQCIIALIKIYFED